MVRHASTVDVNLRNQRILFSVLSFVLIYFLDLLLFIIHLIYYKMLLSILFLTQFKSIRVQDENGIFNKYWIEDFCISLWIWYVICVIIVMIPCSTLKSRFWNIFLRVHKWFEIAIDIWNFVANMKIHITIRNAIVHINALT